jgi:hypothetical protein
VGLYQKAQENSDVEPVIGAGFKVNAELLKVKALPILPAL